MVLRRSLLLVLALVASLLAAAWTAPVEPVEVVVRFDPPDHPYGPGHRGVDLAGAPGQPVVAAGDGVVTFAGQVGGVGVVSVTHGSLRTTYQPVDPVVVRGAAVRGGQVVGHLVLGASHCAPDACLHWGAISADGYVDPMQLLDPGPSRLLPYWSADRAPVAPLRQVGAVGGGRTAERRPAEDMGDPRRLPTGAVVSVAVAGGLVGAALFAWRRRE